MYSEITNNCYIDIFMIVVLDRITVVFEHIRRIRIAWTWPCTAPVRQMSQKISDFFSGFITNGLHHWFAGKGQRRNP